MKQSMSYMTIGHRSYKMNLIELEKHIKEHKIIEKYTQGFLDGYIDGVRDEEQSHHYYKRGYDFGIDLYCKLHEETDNE